MLLTIDQLTMVPETQFGLEQLRLHPVWARYYEPDDIDVACSWGIDRSVFVGWLSKVHHGNDHAFFPVYSLNPLPDDELDLYARASITTVSGNEFDGYLSSDAHYICFYTDDVVSLSFSNHPDLDDLRADEIKRFQARFPDDSLFPLRYSTPFKRSDGSELIGDFNP